MTEETKEFANVLIGAFTKAISDLRIEMKEEIIDLKKEFREVIAENTDKLLRVLNNYEEQFNKKEVLIDKHEEVFKVVKEILDKDK